MRKTPEIVFYLDGKPFRAVRGGVAMFTWEFTQFRFYADDAGEAASTPLENEGIDHTLSVSADTAIQLRCLIEETGGADGTSMDGWQLQYSKNSGTATDLTTTDSGDGIRAVAAGLTNDNATTNRGTNGISDPGSGSFVAGEQSSDGLIDDMQLTTGNFTEQVWGIEFVNANVANNDTFDFTISTPGGGTNTATPRITISKSAVNPTFVQVSYRGRNDDGSESAATWKCPINTNWMQKPDTNFRVRFLIEETAGATTGTLGGQLQYRKNGGAWTNVTGASSNVIAVASANVTDEGATTQQLGSGTFQAGKIDEADGNIGDISGLSSEETELEYVLQIVDADTADYDDIELRVIGKNDDTTALDTYTSIPKILVFDPATVLDVPTVEAWHDPAQGVTLNGSDMSGWYDMTGNGYNFSQATAANQYTPVDSNVNLNSKPSINCPGVTEYMTTATFTAISQPVLYIQAIDLNAAGNNTYIQDGIASGNRHAIFFNGTGLSFYAGTVMNTSTALTTDKVILSVLFNGASTEWWLNGVSQGTGNAGTNTITGWTLTAIWSVGSYQNMDWGDKVVLVSPTDAQHDTIGNYMGTRYGITWTNIAAGGGGIPSSLCLLGMGN